MESTNIPVEIEAKFKQATVKGGVAVLQFEVDTEDSAAFEAIRKSGEEVWLSIQSKQAPDPVREPRRGGDRVMEDYKGMFAELADLATEEQAMSTISVITKSDEAFDKFMDARERLAKWIVEHAVVIDEALTERKYNRMLNEEVR